MEEVMMMMKKQPPPCLSSHQTTTKSPLNIHKNSQTISKVKPNIRIIHIFAPEIIKTDVENFRELVQRLTGKPTADHRRHHHHQKGSNKIKDSINQRHHHHHQHLSTDSIIRDKQELCIENEQNPHQWMRCSVDSRNNNLHGVLVTKKVKIRNRYGNNLGFKEKMIKKEKEGQREMWNHHQHWSLDMIIRDEEELGIGHEENSRQQLRCSVVSENNNLHGSVTKKVKIRSGYDNNLGVRENMIKEEEEEEEEEEKRAIWNGANSGGYLAGFADLDGFLQELGGEFPLLPMEANHMHGFGENLLA